MSLTYDSLKAYIDGLYADGSLTEKDYNDVILYILANGDLQNSPRDLIQVLRGAHENLPNLSQGELGFTLDTEQFFIGGLNGNVGLTNEKKINSSMSQIEIQSILDMGGNIRFLNGFYEVTIDPVTFKGYELRSDSVIVFDKDAVIQVVPNSLDNYYIISCDTVYNIEIVNPHVVGDKTTHLGTTGEWGHGIALLGSKNITIEKPIIDECWGDGIYIGESVTVPYCEDISVIRPLLDSNRRQGISVISVKRLFIDHPVIKNTRGTAPSAGIDLEPNKNTQFLEDITIESPLTINCDGAGIIYSPYYLNGSSGKVTVNINNHRDIGSRYGFSVVLGVGEIGGVITVNNPYYKNNVNAAIYTLSYEHTCPRIDIINPVIENCNSESLGSSDYYDSAILIMRPTGQAHLNDIGNIHIFYPTIKNDVSSKSKYNFTLLNNIVGQKVVNCSIIDPVLIENPTVTSNLWSSCENLVLKDSFGQMVSDDFTGTIYANTLFKTYTNKDAVAQRNIVLSSTLPIGSEINFIVESDNLLILTPNGDTKILPGGVANQSISSGVKGSRLTLRKANTTEWFIVNQSGTWAFT